ncbi:NAD(P)H-hydrate epimerase [Snodgrassella alvi]|uniref:NAD(P)H-hydrate epimerase n=1 Tax=Snodgrassella alvi TaxID=1196083 RepID=UPI000C1F84FD|nr:NAD(P)H-hydrate epimerase [Snodgrassella alvi]PIT15803.1 NAD(P)H-hydrate epimerase [Snodgrassella alvi]PIT18955.1 NAD(P)H-hydrate epimerase [Snodgrassella alvi]
MHTPVWTVTQMRSWEDEQNKAGLSYARMMEHAGSRAAEDLMERFPSPQHTLVLCGKGNNAGDGLVLARRLVQQHWPVTIMWLQGQQLSVLAAANRVSLPATVECADIAQLDTLLPSMQVVVDAVYGTGFYGELPQIVRQCFAAVAQADVFRVALDMPSGVAGDGDVVASGSFQAQLTYAFQALKPAHCLAQVRQLCGEVLCINLQD